MWGIPWKQQLYKMLDQPYLLHDKSPLIRMHIDLSIFENTRSISNTNPLYRVILHMLCVTVWKNMSYNVNSSLFIQKSSFCLRWVMSECLKKG